MIQRFLPWFALLLGLMAPGISQAQEKFPERPIEVVVMFPPGGGADITVRAFSSVIGKYLDQPFIVLNKPGGSGLLAGSFLTRAKPDGYTVGVLVNTGADPELFKYFREPTYKFEDFSPIMRLAVDPFGLVVKADAPWKTLDDFVDDTKRNPGKFSWAHQGVGHSYHLRGTALAEQNGLKMVDVPFRGTADEVAAVLSGTVEAAIVSVAGSRSLIEGGKLRMLAVQHPQRLPYLPGVPTFAEAGYDTNPQFPLHYTGIFVPKGTPKDRILILHDAIKKALDDPQFTAVMARGGSEIYYGTAEELEADVENMRSVFGTVFETLGLK